LNCLRDGFTSLHPTGRIGVQGDKRGSRQRGRKSAPSEAPAANSPEWNKNLLAPTKESRSAAKEEISLVRATLTKHQERAKVRKKKKHIKTQKKKKGLNKKPTKL